MSRRPGKNSVKTNDIKKGAVTSAKIADQTIKSRDLKDGIRSRR